MRTIDLKDVGTFRLRVLLREARIDPSKMTDREVRILYKQMFGSKLYIHADEDRD